MLTLIHSEAPSLSKSCQGLPMVLHIDLRGGDGHFLKLGYPKIIHFSRIFHCKSSISGFPIYENPHVLRSHDQCASGHLDLRMHPR